MYLSMCPYPVHVALSVTHLFFSFYFFPRCIARYPSCTRRDRGEATASVIYSSARGIASCAWLHSMAHVYKHIYVSSTYIYITYIYLLYGFAVSTSLARLSPISTHAARVRLLMKRRRAAAAAVPRLRSPPAYLRSGANYRTHSCFHAVSYSRSCFDARRQKRASTRFCPYEWSSEFWFWGRGD